MPKSVSVLIEKPNSFMNANVPMSETGIVIAGISVLRQFCRNRNSTRTTRHDRLAERLQHFDDRLADDADVVERDLRLEARREVRLEALDLGLDAVGTCRARWPSAGA